MREILLGWCVLLSISLPVASYADDWDVIAHVTQVEPSYVPNNLVFAIDKNAGSCAVGPWLFFNGVSASNNLPENVKAMYVGLLAAMMSGNAIEVYGNNSGCVVSNIHFLNHP